MPKRDLYEVLGIPKSASADEIKKAHRKAVRQHHPDRNKNNPQAEEKFREAQEAYDILSDPQKRQNYDQFGHAGVGGGGPGPSEGFRDPFEQFRRQQRGTPPRGNRQWQAGPNVSVEDFDFRDSGGFGDIFEQFFGAGGPAAGARGGARPGARGRPAPQRGEDVEHPVTLTFEQAARGARMQFQLNRDGRVQTLEVNIPPGVKDGSRIRMKGQGQQTNGEPGDLYIVTSVTPHPYFRREDLDIHLDVPISLYESILGTKVQVPTLDGPVTITIPPGTSSHAKLRIRGRGIERSGQKGDQIVITKIIMPKDLSESEKLSIAEMAKQHPIDARADVPWK
jgi:DnaJ-class molecular chaperone